MKDFWFQNGIFAALLLFSHIFSVVNIILPQNLPSAKLGKAKYDKNLKELCPEILEKYYFAKSGLELKMFISVRIFGLHRRNKSECEEIEGI